MSETPTIDPTPTEESLDAEDLPADPPTESRPQRRPQSPWRGHGPQPWSNLSPTR
jgi:hypothetical protein